MRFISATAAALALALAAGAAPSRADVTWEHTGTVTLTGMKQPVLSFKVFNAWTPQRQKLYIAYQVDTSATPPGMGEPGAAPSYHYGSLGLVQRFDDDRIVMYTSETKSYLDEPRLASMEKLRFDPWKKLAPQLSQKVVPGLTEEQRERLGAEVRAVMKPFLNEFWRNFYRPLPDQRTFNGIAGHGYRLGSMFNTGGPGSNDQWMRTTAEWWLADDMPGDDLIRQFQHTARDAIKGLSWPSTSMWMNETWPVIWHMMPEELHQALGTFLPPEASPRAGFGGTPLLLTLTVTPPPSLRKETGELKLEIKLAHRGTDAVAATAFDAPEGYKKESLDKILKSFNDMIPGDMGGPPQAPKPEAAPTAATTQALIRGILHH